MPVYGKGRLTLTQISPAQVNKTCQRCGREFWIIKSVSNDFAHCCERCHKLAKSEAKKAREAISLSAIVEVSSKAEELANALAPPPTESEPLTPEMADALRGSIANVVIRHIAVADRVLCGTLAWNANQVNLFKTLINKVIPDLSANLHHHKNSPRDDEKPPEALSREELERFAALQARPIINQDHTNADPEPSQVRSPILNDPHGAG